MKVKVGDNVIIRTGSDRGKAGTIAKVLKKQGKVVIEGVNKKVKHVKGRDGNPGERVEIFAPIDASNVSVVDDKGKAARIGYKIEGGKKIRIAKTTGKEITAGVKKEKKAPAKKVATSKK